MSEYIDVYIDTTTKVPEDATEFDYELFERFMSGGPWVAHSKYMELKAENAKLRELVSGLEYCAQGFVCDGCPLYDPSGTNHRRCESLERELGIEVDE